MAISRPILIHLITITSLLVPCVLTQKKPHIITILADDMGWNDVSFHGSNQIPTPNIDALAYNGIVLKNHYVQALCTPSRTAFMTGKYPIHLGMQHLVLLEPEPRGLPLSEKLLPEYLRDAGYSTHAVGKWHLGYYKKEYTPTYRGFDSHFGYWNGIQDYYNHNVRGTFESDFVGYDMRRNMSIDFDAKGKYSTTLFTDEAVKLINEHNNEKPMFLYMAHLAPHTGNPEDPLQAPDEEVARFAYIEDPERRVYAAMVSMLDKSVGTVVAALREKRMLENSIIIFISDNGAQTQGTHANHGSNYPLRGMKGGPWEGGVKTVAAVWSPLINSTQRVSNQLMHMSDWLPTLYAAAGMKPSQLGNIDGVNMWPSLSENFPSPRIDVVINIDEVDNYSSLRKGDWKYIMGSVLKGAQDNWYGDSGENTTFEYDINEVLNSKTGIAISGVITAKQLEEKRAMKIVPENHKYKKNYLTAEKVEQLRGESSLTCTPRNELEANPKTVCRPLDSPCLFNLIDDPCETVNLASERPLILMSLEESILHYRKTIIPANNVESDPKANPSNWNNVWTHWQDKCPDCGTGNKKISPLILGIIIGASILFVIIVCTVLLCVCKSKSPYRSSPRTNISSIMKAFDLRSRTPKTHNDTATINPNMDDIESKTNDVLRGGDV